MQLKFMNLETPQKELEFIKKYEIVLKDALISQEDVLEDLMAILELEFEWLSPTYAVAAATLRFLFDWAKKNRIKITFECEDYYAILLGNPEAENNNS